MTKRPRAKKKNNEEKRAYSRIETDLQEKLITEVLINNKSVYRAAADCGINYQNAKSIVRRRRAVLEKWVPKQ